MEVENGQNCSAADHKRSQEGGPRAPLKRNNLNDKIIKKALFVSISFSIFVYNSTRVQH